MPIPGYDPTDVHEITLEYQDDPPTVLDSSSHEQNSDERTESGESGDTVRDRAHVAVVADRVPDSVSVRESDLPAPADALTEPIELVGFEVIDGLEAIQLTLAYDPAALPPGASPTDVAVGFQTRTECEQVPSAVDLERTTVTAILTEPPAWGTVVAVHAVDDEELVGRIE
ncbi:hypothetical protein EL22_05290 [Halostagnicola sp. A56]|uniref:hypothetical protein n=1 Tax=Halostagnicola sp. A56 TaxID=1495067 RepID=UPI00049FF16E|nr:hypothetical protein [Halostagnicola sp. A56]KDE58380.1 hypothetical protein EL22_05290 [Halostagnicola sp. A56]